MSLFGNRELNGLKSALEHAEARVQKAEAEIQAVARKLAAAETRARDAENRCGDLVAEVAGVRRDSERLGDSKARADKAAAFFEERCESLKNEIESARMSLEQAARIEADARALEETMKAENARLKSDNERLSDQVERLKAARKPPEKAQPAEGAPQAVSVNATGTDELRELRAEIDGLKRRMAECDEMRRVALRKAEHNRRAWLVTQMQLDLAEDRICLLTTGKPRPVLESRFSEDVGAEVVEAEDVEDAVDVADAGPGQTPAE